MVRFGKHIVIGPTNTYLRMRGYPMISTKRYPHETKKYTKDQRVKIHRMQRVGCDDELIKAFVPEYEGRSNHGKKI